MAKEVLLIIPNLTTVLPGATKTSQTYSERIAGETARTPANCDVVLDGTLCAWTAGETARVNAPVVLAGLVGRTLRVGDTIA